MTLSSKLEIAERALERGDYQKCLYYLEEVAKNIHPSSQEGAKIRLLMITALIGKGENKQAIELCHTLAKQENHTYRQQAQDIISILDAPILSKPENWSVKIPALKGTSSIYDNYKRQKIPSKEVQKQHPPTGPTQPFQKGFAILVATILFALTMLLSGCVQFTTDIELTGPDRLKVGWEVQSNSDQLLPWQEKFITSLSNITPKVNVQTRHEGKQLINSSQINSKEANLLLQTVVDLAAEAAAFHIPSPRINLKEENLLIGVRQHLSVFVDLKGLPEFPGLKLLMIVNPSAGRKPPKGEPISPRMNGSQVNWELAQGQINKLELYSWQWNPIGLGIITVLIITILTILVQNLKVELGFGFPELPP